MNNLSNEHLEFIRKKATAATDYVYRLKARELESMLDELLALREAGKEPVAVVLVEEDTSDQHRVAWTIKGQNLTDGRHELYAAPQLPEGWVMVPREMTDEIGEAIALEAKCCGGIALDIYNAAIAAAPKPEPEPAVKK